jgi:methenyltetrahydromethanopterin cyclohydrolase
MENTIAAAGPGDELSVALAQTASVEAQSTSIQVATIQSIFGSIGIGAGVDTSARH